ncbi:hypothetical protein BLA29_009241, partial [Euroglyphus maynei]
ENDDDDDDEKNFEPESPDHTPSSNIKRSLNIDYLNISPCCTSSNNSTVIGKSPSLLAKISADDQECSFSYEDRLELLQTKITYENQIIELHEKLDQQTENNSEQALKMQTEQMNNIQKEYDIQCQKSKDQIDNLYNHQKILQDELEQQKNRYESIIGELEETMEQLRMNNASLKNQYETNAMAQINELKQRHEQLSIQLYESQNENQKLDNCILEMDKQRCHLRETIESMKSNMIELNSHLVESVHEREVLKSRLNDMLEQKSNFDNEFQSKLIEGEQKITSLELIVAE